MTRSLPGVRRRRYTARGATGLTALALAIAATAAGADAAPARNSPAADYGSQLAQVSGVGNPTAMWMFTEPQRTMVDVYYGGRLLLSTPARYTLDTLEFLDYEQVVKSLPNVLVPAALVNHLQGEIPTNAALVCVSPGQPEGCGKLEPDFVGVIFDESRFRADIFVHPDLLAAPAPMAARYLPPPTSTSPALVQGLGAVVSDSETGDALYGLYGQTWVGDGRQRVFSFWNSTDRSDFSIGQLAWQRDYTDHLVTAGLFESQFGLLRVMRRDPIAGVGVRRSLDTRLDIQEINGGDIQVFLANRSQVDILRDGRLLTSAFYEAGNQRIDGSRLPPGAYNIELRITDATGLQRTITRFFVKSSLIAPANHPLYFAEAGRVLDRTSTTLMPRDAGTPLALGGYQWRHRDDIGLSLAGAATESEVMPEFGVVWVGDRLDAGGEVYYSSEGDGGFALRGSRSWEDAVVSVVTQHSEVGARPQPDTEYHLVPDETSYTGLNASRAAWEGQLTASLYRSKAVDNTTADGWSLGYTRGWRAGPQSALTLGTQLGAADGDMYGEVSLQWRYGHGDWQHTIKPILRESKVSSRPDGFVLEGSSSWQDGDRYIDDLRAEANIALNDELSTLALEGEHASEYGLTRVAAQSASGTQDNTQLSAMADTNIVAANGSIGFGSPHKGQSGVLLDLRGVPEDSLVDVLVDGRRQFSARGGRQVALALPPYRTYRIGLRDRGTNSYAQFEQDEQEVTLYPGNAVRLDWKMNQVLVVLGRLYRHVELCDAAGHCELTAEPMVDAVVRSGKALTFTEENGFFQIDMSSSTPELEVESGDLRCLVPVDTATAREGILRVPALYCEPLLLPTPAAEADTDTGLNDGADNEAGATPGFDNGNAMEESASP